MLNKIIKSLIAFILFLLAFYLAYGLFIYLFGKRLIE